MATPMIEILVLTLLVLANGLFAMAEIAIVSARKERLQGMASQGVRGASAAISLADDPNRFLSTVQICITLIGIFAGAFGGATIADRLSARLDQVSWLSSYSDAIGVGVVVVLIAYFSLVVGELAPKRLGLRSPERVASSVAPSMRALSVIAAPVVGLLSFSTNLVMRLVRASSPVDRSITEDEIKLLMREGQQAGSIEPGERQMVFGVFQLHDRPVTTFMTLGADIAWLDVKDSVAELSRKIRESKQFWFPVCSGSLQEVVGMAAAQNLLAASLAGGAVVLESVAGQTLLIPETSTGSGVLNLFLETGDNAGLVIDEHGVVLGMVTINEILDQIVGEDAEEIVRQGESWVADGRVSLEVVEDVMQVQLDVPYEESGTYESLGGFVMARLGRVPSVGDSLTWNGIEFRVQRMAGNRVSRVMVTPQEPADDDPERPEVS